MKILILHWHKRCPKCGQVSCFFVDFRHDEDGCKYDSGFYECNTCHSLIVNSEFNILPEIEPIKCSYQNLELATNDIQKSSNGEKKE
jgi:hypothetical protein